MGVNMMTTAATRTEDSPWKTELDAILSDLFRETDAFLSKMGRPFSRGLKYIINHKDELPTLYRRALPIIQAKLNLILPKYTFKTGSPFKGKTKHVLNVLIRDFLGGGESE